MESFAVAPEQLGEDKNEELAGQNVLETQENYETILNNLEISSHDNSNVLETGNPVSLNDLTKVDYAGEVNPVHIRVVESVGDENRAAHYAIGRYSVDGATDSALNQQSDDFRDAMLSSNFEEPERLLQDTDSAAFFKGTPLIKEARMHNHQNPISDDLPEYSCNTTELEEHLMRPNTKGITPVTGSSTPSKRPPSQKLPRALMSETSNAEFFASQDDASNCNPSDSEGGRFVKPGTLSSSNETYDQSTPNETILSLNATRKDSLATVLRTMDLETEVSESIQTTIADDGTQIVRDVSIGSAHIQEPSLTSDSISLTKPVHKQALLNNNNNNVQQTKVQANKQTYMNNVQRNLSRVSEDPESESRRNSTVASQKRVQNNINNKNNNDSELSAHSPDETTSDCNPESENVRDSSGSQTVDTKLGITNIEPVGGAEFELIEQEGRPCKIAKQKTEFEGFYDVTLEQNDVSKLATEKTDQPKNSRSMDISRNFDDDNPFATAETIKTISQHSSREKRGTQSFDIQTKNKAGYFQKRGSVSEKPIQVGRFWSTDCGDYASSEGINTKSDGEWRHVDSNNLDSDVKRAQKHRLSLLSLKTRKMNRLSVLKQSTRISYMTGTSAKELLPKDPADNSPGLEDVLERMSLEKKRDEVIKTNGTLPNAVNDGVSADESEKESLKKDAEGASPEKKLFVSPSKKRASIQRTMSNTESVSGAMNRLEKASFTTDDVNQSVERVTAWFDREVLNDGGMSRNQTLGSKSYRKQQSALGRLASLRGMLPTNSGGETTELSRSATSFHVSAEEAVQGVKNWFTIPEKKVVPLKSCLKQEGSTTNKKKKVRFRLPGRSRLLWAIITRLSLLRLLANPHFQIFWPRFHVSLLTYELWALPFRLALGPRAVDQYHSPWLYLDMAVDALFALDVVFQLIYTYKLNNMENSGQKTGISLPQKPKSSSKKAQNQMAKLNKVKQQEQEKEGTGYTYKDMALSLTACSTIYLGLAVANVADVENKFKDWIFWVFTMPRFIRPIRLYQFFRGQEMAIHVDMRKVAMFKFAILVFGITHYVGCGFFWISRTEAFNCDPYSATWICQLVDLTSLPISLEVGKEVAGSYLIILFKGFNCMTNLGYELAVPKRKPEILFAILVFFVQIGVEAFILGTIFHYLVKKDANMEAFRKRMQRLEDYSAERNLPQSLRVRLNQYFEFQYQKKRTDDPKIMRSLPQSLQVKVAAHQHADILLRNRSLFRRCNTQFLHILMVRLREVYLMPGEVNLRQGDMSRSIGFVTHGSLACTKDGKLLKSIRADSDGPSMIGEVAFFMGISEPYTVAARVTGDVTLLVFTKFDYEELVESYPEQHDILVTNLLANYELDKSGNSVSVHVSVDEGDDEHQELKGAIQAALNKRNSDALSAMHYAASEGDVDTVKTLLHRGLPVNSADYDMRTTLHLACLQGNIKVVELLLEEGADVNSQDRWGNTPLQSAIAMKQQAIIFLLESQQARVMYPDPAAELAHAALTGIGNMKLLLRNGIDPNICDYDQRTALHIVASKGSLRMADFLVGNAQCAVNVVDRWGWTPLQSAVAESHDLVSSLLHKHGGKLLADVVKQFCQAAAEGDLKKLRLLQDNGVNVDVVDYDLRTALHIACANSQVLSVDHLLNACHADANLIDRWQSTPLDDALDVSCLEAAVLVAGAGGESGKKKISSVSELLLEKEAPSIKAVRKKVQLRVSRVNEGKMFADMWDDAMTDQFNARMLYETLTCVGSLKVTLEMLLLKYKEISFFIESLRLGVIDVVDKEKLDKLRQNEALGRRAANLALASAATSAATSVPVEIEIPATSKHNSSAWRTKQLNRFMLQLNRVTPTFLSFEEKLVNGICNDQGESISRDLQLHQALQALDIRASTAQIAMILDDIATVCHEREPLSLSSLAVCAPFRELVKDESPEELALSPGDSSVLCLKQAFEVIDEAFDLFDINKDGGLEAEELRKFWDMGDTGGGKMLEALLFREKGPRNKDGSLNISHFTLRYLALVGVSIEDGYNGSGSEGSDRSSESEDDRWSDPDDLDEASTFYLKLLRDKGEDGDDDMDDDPSRITGLFKGGLLRAEKKGVAGNVTAWLRSIFGDMQFGDRYQSESLSVKYKKEIMRKIDIDGSGRVDFKELSNAFREMSARGLGGPENQMSAPEILNQLEASIEADNAEKTKKNANETNEKTREGEGRNKKRVAPMKQFFKALSELNENQLQTLMLGLHTVTVVSKQEQERPPDAHWLVMLPASPVARNWKNLIRLVVVYYLLEVPFHIAFRPDNTVMYHWYMLFNAIADLLMVLDLIFNCFLAYTNKKSVLVYDLTKIRRHYLGHDFLSSFLVSVPFDYIVWAMFTLQSQPRPHQLLAWLRLPKLGRVWHLYTTLRTKASDTKADTVQGGVKRLMPTLLAMSHLMACIWWAIGDVNTGADSQSRRWVTYYQGFGREDFAVDGSLMEKYLLSFYWISCALATSGLVGAMTPRNYYEIGFTCFVMFMSMTVYSYVLGEISNLVMKQDEALVATRSSILQVESFARQRALPEELQVEISHFFKYLSGSEGGEDQEDVFDLLSHTLQVHVAKYISRTPLEAVILFQECSETFLDSLSVLLRESTVLPDTYVFRTNEVSRELYIVQAGVVELTTDTDEVDGETNGGDERVEALLSRHEIFGEVSFLFGMRQTSHARTPPNMTAALFTLQKQDYNQLVKLYPEEEEKIIKSILFSFDQAQNAGRNAGGAGNATANSGKSAVSGNSGVDTNALDDANKVRAMLNVAKEKKRSEKVVALVEAASKGDLREVARVLDSGEVEVNETDWDKRTPLHLAASEGLMDMVTLLVETYKADINIQDRYQGTPLMDAFRHKHDNIAAYLRKHGGVLELPEPAYHLCSVAAEGDLVQFQRMVDCGITYSLADYDNRTAMHLAASNGHLHILQYIATLEDGVNFNVEDDMGGTPLADAIAHGHVEVQAFLRSQGATVGSMDIASKLCQAGATNDLHSIQTLQRNGVDLNSVNYARRTCLHLAASMGHLEVTQWLLGQKGLDKSPLDIHLNTPLDDAKRHGHKVCALLLEEKGAISSSEVDPMIIAKMSKFARKGSLVLAEMEEELRRRYEDRLKKMISTSKESEVLLSASTLLEQVTEKAGDLRSLGSTFLQIVSDMIDFHLHGSATWGASEVAAATQLQKVSEQLTSVITFFFKKIGNKDSRLYALAQRTPLLSVLNAQFLEASKTLNKNLKELLQILEVVIQEGNANDYYYEAVNSSRSSSRILKVVRKQRKNINLFIPNVYQENADAVVRSVSNRSVL